MSPTPSDRVPDVHERLGAANELLAAYCNPESAMRLGELINPGHIEERFRAHLDREEQHRAAAGWQPFVYGATPPAVAQAMAASIPWPAHATGDM